jgi:hypothetical protein
MLRNLAAPESHMILPSIRRITTRILHGHQEKPQSSKSRGRQVSEAQMVQNTQHIISHYALDLPTAPVGRLAGCY